MPQGTLVLLILRVLQSGPLHGPAIARRIQALSAGVLRVDDGALYPALRRILANGWAAVERGESETSHKIRFYRLTLLGRKQLDAASSTYARVHGAVQAVLPSA